METSDKIRTHGSDSDELAKPSETASGTKASVDKLTSITDEKKQHDSSQVEHVETACIQQEALIQQEQGGFENSKEPTRYGDWEIAGRCVDF